MGWDGRLPGDGRAGCLGMGGPAAWDGRAGGMGWEGRLPGGRKSELPEDDGPAAVEEDAVLGVPAHGAG
jgi:hypothetical protein